MGHHTYEQSKSIATKTILILAAITVFEVLFALLGKGYLISGVTLPGWLTGGMMIVLSIVKAYLIIFEFMHMKYEIPGLAKTVLVPVLLLVWGAIAFVWEGDYWNTRKAKQHTKKELKQKDIKSIGFVERAETFNLG